MPHRPDPSLLPLAARQAAWDAVWRVLLRNPDPASSRKGSVLDLDAVEPASEDSPAPTGEEGQ